MVTDPHKHKQTHRQDRLQYTVSQLARSVIKTESACVLTDALMQAWQ